jgi:DNA polymerase-3 subunit chi
MIQVDFYLLNQTDELEKDQFVCRLIYKAYHHKHRVYIRCPDLSKTQHLDELLWTFTDESFIPHNIIGEGPTFPPPVQIGHEAIPTQHNDILVNLCEDIPSSFKQFKRILEIIPNNEEARNKARENYRYYREQGCKLVYHNL